MTAELSGTVDSVCTGSGGIPKHAVAEALVSELGLEGDGHRYHLHGGADRAVCLFSLENYRALQADGVACEAPGAFGENLLTEGFDDARLEIGDHLQVGDEVVLEVFDVREPCVTLKPIDARFPELLIGRSGWLCRVVHTGTVRAGDAIVRRVRSATAT
jgi:MOSC domain-containing protein YiiM